MSLRGDKYENNEEVQFRLQDTVVLYDNEPVYITRVRMTENDGLEDEDNIARVFFKPLPLVGGGKEFRKYLSSRKFSLTPFPLGYMNVTQRRGQGPRVLHLSRKPVRQSKQGLCGTNLTIENVRGERDGDEPFSDIIRMQGFCDMIKGKYPSFKEAGELLEDAEDKLDAVAVSSKYVIRPNPDLDLLYLMHRKCQVGFALRGETSIRLSRKYQFLREELAAMNIPVKE